MQYRVTMSLETNQIIWKCQNGANYSMNPQCSLYIATNNQINTTNYKRLIIEGTGLYIHDSSVDISKLYYFSSKMQLSDTTTNGNPMTTTPLGVLGEVDRSISTTNKVIIPFTLGVTRYLGVRLYIRVNEIEDGLSIGSGKEYTITRIYFE